MPRRAKRSSDSTAAWLQRTLLFWIAPLVFLLLVISKGERAPDSVTNVVGVLAVLFTVSSCKLVGECVCRCQGLTILQLILQIVLLFVFLREEEPAAAALSASSAVAAEAPRQIVPEPSLQQTPVRASATADIAVVAQDGHKDPPSVPVGAAPPIAAVHGQGAGSLLRGSTVDDPDKLSIVIPCLNESEFAVKTVKSFCDRTPAEALEEIIVVDDGSSPPLEPLFRQAVGEHCRLKVLRHEKPYGLMIAKQTGGDAAKGKFIGFFDCHVAPRRGWEVELIQKLKEKERRLVIPEIGDLNVTTWDEIPGGQLITKCYISWDSEFWWYDDATEYVAIISGGLVATSRDWWQLSGGFDHAMRGWGGENIDQSLRAWLCGGDVVRAKTSIIAHMWRVERDPRTLSRYRFKGQTDNTARVAAVWLDEFAFKFRKHGPPPGIDVSSELRMKERLGCKPYVHFLHRFRRVFWNAGVLPQRVFKLRLSGSDKCIHRAGRSYGLGSCAHAAIFNLGNHYPVDYPDASALSSVRQDPRALDTSKQVTCGGHHAWGCSACPQGHGAGWCHADCIWVFGQCVAKELAQEVKMQTPGTCCSGIREWDSMECFEGKDGNAAPQVAKCDVTGKWDPQHYMFDTAGRIMHSSGNCIGVIGGSALASVDCKDAPVWEQAESYEPRETQLYLAAVQREGLTEEMPSQ